MNKREFAEAAVDVMLRKVEEERIRLENKRNGYEFNIADEFERAKRYLNGDSSEYLNFDVPLVIDKYVAIEDINKRLASIEKTKEDIMNFAAEMAKEEK